MRNVVLVRVKIDFRETFRVAFNKERHLTRSPLPSLHVNHKTFCLRSLELKEAPYCRLRAVRDQNGGFKYATGASSKIRRRDNITIGTWNTRTLRAAGKLQELTHEMDRHR